MPEDIPKKSPASAAPIALTFFLMLIAAALAFSQRTARDALARFFMETLAVISLQVSYNVIPALVTAAIIYFYKRNNRVFLLALALIAIHALVLVIRAFVEPSTDRWSRRSLFDYAIDFTQFLTNPSLVIPLMALLSFRFRGKLDRIRIAAIVLIALMPAAYISIFWLYGDSYHLLRTFLNCAYFGTLLFCAWCIVFRRHDAPNRPPVDARRAIALTCPRCLSPQTIESGHGECANCRLQITISLDEGVCSRCRYPLRGLTGDKCPECGTPIIAPPEPAEPTAPAAH
jgi:hypothetical protein